MFDGPTVSGTAAGVLNGFHLDAQGTQSALAVKEWEQRHAAEAMRQFRGFH